MDTPVLLGGIEMAAESAPLDNRSKAQGDDTRYRVMLESIYKFRLFFVGFVFAILSFAMQFQAKATSAWVKLPEFTAWIFLAAVGWFALRDCGGFARLLTEKVVEGIDPPQRLWMWALFLVAVLLLLFARIADGVFGLNRT